MAAPTYIPIKGDTKSHSGPLGIVKVIQPRSTEIEALHPRRQRHERQYTFEPPTYTDEQGVKRACVWCRGCEEKLRKLTQQGSRPKWTAWRKRSEFYVDRSRPTERLQRLCKTCMKEYVTMRRRGNTVDAA